MIELFKNNIDAILPYLLGTGGFFSLWFQRRKQKGDALAQMQESYAVFVRHSEQKFKDFEREILELQQEMQRVKEKWREKYQALKQEFETYKKKHP